MKHDNFDILRQGIQQLSVNVSKLEVTYLLFLRHMQEIEFRTRPEGDMADQAVNVIANTALHEAGEQKRK